MARVYKGWQDQQLVTVNRYLSNKLNDSGEQKNLLFFFLARLTGGGGGAQWATASC